MTKGGFYYLRGRACISAAFARRPTGFVFYQLFRASYHSCLLFFLSRPFFVYKQGNMKALCLILFVCCLFQVNGQLRGKLVTTDSLPLQFASISLLTEDSALVKAVVSGVMGDYEVDNISPGLYRLRISIIGYQTWYSETFALVAGQNEKNFGTLVMTAAKRQLEEVVVRAGKSLFQQRPEGTIVNVENSILTKGSSVLQVLERSPGVVINHRDNSISLNGKNGVVVMLNGKLMRMPMEQLVSLLDGMSADDIATVELLTTPPAKYDAEGSAGIINIVLKKNKKQGDSGSLYITGGYGKAEKTTAAMNFSHNTKRVNVFGSYTFSHDKTYTYMYVASSQDMPFLGGAVSVTGWFDTKAISNNHDATAGIDLKLNAKTTIGTSVTYNKINLSGSTVTDAGYNVLPDSLLRFNSINQGSRRWNNLLNSVYLEKVISNDEKINVSADWLYFNNSNRYEVQSSFINKHGVQAGDNQSLFSPAQMGTANTGIQVGVARADYTKQLSKKLKLEAGLKGAYTKSTSLSGILSLLNGAWTGNDETSNHILMQEGIGAAYASLNTLFNASTSLTIGARYEYSYTDMNNSKTGADIINRKLGTLFPSVFFSKKINDNATVQLSYTKRISRPSYNDLASYVGYSDPTAVYTGNPFLQPTITNNIKLGYNYKTWSISLLFSRDDNAIARYQLTESPARDILYISPQNLAWQNNITLQATIPFKINNWWSMNYSFAGGIRQYRATYTTTAFEKRYFGYSANFSQTFKLPANFSVEISGWYNNTAYNGTQKVNGFGVLNAGIKKELKKNAGSLQLSVSDILTDERYNIHYGAVTEEAFSIKSYVSVNLESSMFPIIKLTYSRSFGAGTKGRERQMNGARDEKERIQN